MAFTEDERRAFILGYTDAMKWANTYGPAHLSGGIDHADEIENFDALNDMGIWRFDHDSMVRIEEVCDDFMRATEPMLRAATMISRNDRYGMRDMSHHGHDLALTQNGHGTGFWDRGYPHALGEALTDAAHAWGEASAYVSDEANGLLIYEG